MGYSHEEVMAKYSGRMSIIFALLCAVLIAETEGAWLKQVLIKRQSKIKKGHLVARLKKVDKEFKVEFEFLPGAPSYWWKNVIRFTIGTTDGKKYGDRIPAIFYHGVSYSKLEISSAVNGNGIFTTSVLAPPYTWYKVVIQQLKEKGGKDIYYSIDVNGKNWVNMVNEKPMAFYNVSVWASDPWYSPQTGFIRNLHFYEKGVFTCTKGKWKCRRADECIDLEKRCDYTPHCEDKTDEEDCPTTPPPTTTTTSTTPGPPAYLKFTMHCNELSVTGIWEKKIFQTTGFLEVHLNDPKCDHMGSNDTHIWISTNFTQCASVTHEDEDLLYQQNTAVVTVSHAKENIRRTVSYRYNMRCMFDRGMNVSSSDGFDTRGLTTAVINGSAMANFEASIDIYTSTAFRTLVKRPIKVTSYEPMFIGIKEVNKNKDLKFIVNQCFATPTSRIHDVNYMFFALKCPLDPSLKVLNKSDDRFYFSINAFTFIEITKSVHIHCTLYICRTNSTAPACQQDCKHGRKRREVSETAEDERPLQEGTLTTTQIIFERKQSCEETYCPAHSSCLELYPAVCRCRHGYVESTTAHACMRERVFNVNDLQVGVEFFSMYSDSQSTDFLRLVIEIEKQISSTLHLDEKEIEGVKIIHARTAGKNGLFLDLSLLHTTRTTREKAFESFVRSVKMNGSKGCNISRKRLRVCKDVVPSLESPTVEVIRVVSHDIMLLITVVLPVSAIILVKVGMIMVERYKNSRARNEAKGVVVRGK